MDLRSCDSETKDGGKPTQPPGDLIKTAKIVREEREHFFNPVRHLGSNHQPGTVV